jgi:hypothetical protein
MAGVALERSVDAGVGSSTIGSGALESVTSMILRPLPRAP